MLADTGIFDVAVGLNDGIDWEDEEKGVAGLGGTLELDGFIGVTIGLEEGVGIFEGEGLI